MQLLAQEVVEEISSGSSADGAIILICCWMDNYSVRLTIANHLYSAQSTVDPGISTAFRFSAILFFIFLLRPRSNKSFL